MAQAPKFSARLFHYQVATASSKSPASTRHIALHPSTQPDTCTRKGWAQNNMVTTAAASNKPFVALARSLPPRLQTFFARYPPSPPPAPAHAASSSSPAERTTATDTNKKATTAAQQQKQPLPATKKTLYQNDRPNPFEAWKNPKTGKWQNPVYSYRRQAELVKMAREYGVEELLPPTRKGTEFRLARRVTYGLRVKGTGVGQKIKGHKFERVADEKMEKKRDAVEGMYDMVAEWKRIGAYRWKKFPK
ncbi:putative ribosomal protein YmL25 mitochondrial [Zalerion maritima]|uniref:Ribosomal protein YmL25 mitochondrial n=1 Tax=Zalerion maritima TaxID=339359 RepID=A0AAD5WSR5_9PEZI|nr:putative ribosomal protein YmL25 mitochondrial [Zalerion maritima]